MEDHTNGPDGAPPRGGDVAGVLRREAATVAPGAPQVDAVVRRGRTLRYRRRVAAGGAALVVAAFPVSVALWEPFGAGDPVPPAAQRTTDPEPPAPGSDGGEPGDGPDAPGEARELAADERVDLGGGLWLGLLPGTGPRYAVATDEEWAAAAEAAADQPPEEATLSAELVPSGDTTLVVGGWRVLDDAPEVRLTGPDGGVTATTVTLVGEDTWGVYWADLGEDADALTVEYLDAEGTLVASTDLDGVPDG